MIKRAGLLPLLLVAVIAISSASSFSQNEASGDEHDRPEIDYRNPTFNVTTIQGGNGSIFFDRDLLVGREMFFVGFLNFSSTLNGTIPVPDIRTVLTIDSGGMVGLNSNRDGYLLAGHHWQMSNNLQLFEYTVLVNAPLGNYSIPYAISQAGSINQVIFGDIVLTVTQLQLQSSSEPIANPRYEVAESLLRDSVNLSHTVSLDVVSLAALLNSAASNINSTNILGTTLFEIDGAGSEGGAAEFRAVDLQRELVYTPVSDFIGEEVFAYTITNVPDKLIYSGNITFNVQSSVPIARDITIDPLESGDSFNVIFDVSDDATAIDELQISLQLTADFSGNVTLTSGATVSADDPLVYNVTQASPPTTDFRINLDATNGTHVITYTVTDEDGNTDTADITVMIVATEFPTIRATAARGENGTLDFSVVGPRMNFTASEFFFDPAPILLECPDSPTFINQIANLVDTNRNRLGLTGGISAVGTGTSPDQCNFTIMGADITFTVNEDAAPGIYTLNYGIPDNDADPELQGTVEITLLAPFSTPITDYSIDVTRTDLPTASTTFVSSNITNLIDITANNVASISNLTLSIVDDMGTERGTASFTNDTDTFTLTYDPANPIIATGGSESFTYSIVDRATDRSGRATITFDIVTPPPATQFGTDIDDTSFDVARTDLPIFSTTLTDDDISDLVNADDNSLSVDDRRFLYFVVDDATGSEGGIASFDGSTLTYDPADAFEMSGGAETFTYRIIHVIDNQAGEATLTFNVERPPPTQFDTPILDYSDIFSGNNDGLRIGVTSSITLGLQQQLDLANAVANSIPEADETRLVLSFAANANSLPGARGSTVEFEPTGSSSFTINFVPSADFVNNGGSVTFPYSIYYSATNQIGNATVTIEHDLLPVLEPIPITIARNATDGVISIGRAIDDDRNDFDQLDIQIVGTSTSTPAVSITDLLMFTDDDLDLSNIETQLIDFDVNLDAPLGEHVFNYVVTDTGNGESTNSITLTITAIPPTLEPITSSIQQLDSGVINFGDAITDVVDTHFSNYTVTIRPLLGEGVDTEDPASTIRTHLNFTDSSQFTFNSDTGVIQIHVPIVEVTVKDGVSAGTYVFNYFVFNSGGAMSRNTLTLTITSGPPVTPDINAQLRQGLSGTTNFAGVRDTDTTFENLNVTLTKLSTGDDPVNIDTLISFTVAEHTTDNGDTITIDQTLVDFAAFDEATPGTYTFNYNATNTAGISSDGTFTLTIILRGPPTQFDAGIRDITYTVSRSELPTYGITISGIGSRANAGANGISDTSSLRVSVNDTGDQGGALTINDAHRLFYTPITSFSDVGGSEIFEYSIFDNISNRIGTATITFNLFPPTTPIEVSFAQGESGTFDFVVPDGVLDNSQSDDSGPNIADLVTFTDLNAAGNPLGPNDLFIISLNPGQLIVNFDVKPNAELGTHVYDYGQGGNVFHDVILTITARSPTTPDITVSVRQGLSDIINFTGVTDAGTTFENLNVTLTKESTGDNPVNIDTLISFTVAEHTTDNGDTITIDQTLVDFAASDDATPGTYTFNYNATNNIDVTSDGTLTLTIMPREDPTQFDTAIRDQAFTVSQSELPTFEITLVGIGSLANAGANGISDTSSLRVSVNDTGDQGGALTINNALRLFYTPITSFSDVGGSEIFEYSIFDNISNRIGTATITFNLHAPSTPIEVSVAQGESGTFDFVVPNGVLDNSQSDGSGPNIADLITFTDLNSNGNPLGPNDLFIISLNPGQLIVNFDVKPNAELGTHVYDYGQGSSVFHDVILTITARSPVTPDITVSVIQGQNDIINFTGVTDTGTTFENLNVTLTKTSTGDNPVNIDTLISFTTAGQTTDNGDTITIDQTLVNFAVSDGATLGNYTFNYNATNNIDVTSDGTLTLSIVELMCTTDLGARLDLGTVQVDGSPSERGTININNDGNVPITALELRADNWILEDSQNGSVQTMMASQTHYSTSSGTSYVNAKAFTGENEPVGLASGGMIPSSNIPIYVRAQASLIANAPIGPMVQQIYVSSECN